MTKSQKGRIFISYRRIDTSYAAGRIYDRLAAHFGEVAIFMDVEVIEGGLDFVKVLEGAVQSCDVLIALIGRQWLSAKDQGENRRIDNPEDFVRIEIATALKRDIRVIPVLVDGIDMPRSTELPENLKLLARRNALQVNHRSFNPDVSRLIAHVESALDAAEKTAWEKAERKSAEKTAREKAEREALEKIFHERAKREAVKKTPHDIVERRAVEKATYEKTRRVFISYSIVDLAFVEQLAFDLRAAGLDVQYEYDLPALKGSVRWRIEIEKAIRESQYVLIVLSPDSVASEWVDQEYLFASNLGKKIIPLFYKPCNLPQNYLTLNYIYMQGKNYNRNFNEVLRALDVNPNLPKKTLVLEKKENEELDHKQIKETEHREKGKRGPIYALVGVIAIFITCILGLSGISYLYPQLVPSSVAGFIPWVGFTSTPTPTIMPTVTATSPPKETPTVVPTYEFTSITLPHTGQSPTPSISLTSSPTPVGGGYGQISFASQRTGVPQIYLINVDGSNLHPITNMPEGACQPSWSPDGTILVFTSPCQHNTDSYRESSLYLINADGSDLTQLPTAPGGDFDPAWSPDGSLIAFTSLRDGRKEIYTLDMTTAMTTRLTFSYTDEESSQPAWSPFGNQIVFVKKNVGALQIWTMTDTNQNQEQVVRSGQTLWDYDPVWSPDGQYILFNQRQINTGSLPWVMQIRYEDRETQTASRLKLGVVGVENVSYSTDGFWMVYEGVDERDNTDVYYMTASGAIRTRLTTDPGDDFDPAWRPIQ